MSRVSRKTQDFDLALEITREGFIRTPRPEQREWVVQRALDECADDLNALDGVARRFVEGSARAVIEESWAGSSAQYDGSQLVIQGQQVMQDWERPLMKAMAEIVCETHGDVLELGFGMGISASYIQELGVRSYTVIECNAEVAERFERWKGAYPGCALRLVLGKWQDVIHTVGEFDGIFFDTYPLSEAEFVSHIIEDVTFAAHFFSTAAAHLKPGGIFSYYTNEIDSFSRRHQRLLLRHFKSFTLSKVTGLQPPPDCHYWWADSMMAVKAIK